MLLRGGSAGHTHDRTSRRNRCRGPVSWPSLRASPAPWTPAGAGSHVTGQLCPPDRPAPRPPSRPRPWPAF